MIARRTMMTAAVAFAAIGLGAPAAAQDDITIGLAVANLQADFFNQIKQSVERAGSEAGVEIITVDARGDAATQVSQVQDLITRQIDALIYIPAGATAAGVPVQAARDAGIPVIAVDRNPPDVPGDTFIATDSVAAARELGEWVVEQTGGTAQIGIIQGQLGTTPEIDRDTGFNQALEDQPGMEVVGMQASNMWMQDEGFSIAQDMLLRHPDITVFFGRADALALGAAQAVQVANLDHDVLVVGFDGDFAGLEAVRDGVLDATMTQQTQLMGRMAFEAAVALINGEEVPEEQLMPATLTTPDNATEFLENHP